MDKFELRAGSLDILGNKVFIEFYEEAYSAQLRKLELGDPNNPEELVKANLALRTLRELKRKFELAANVTIEEG